MFTGMIDHQAEVVEAAQNLSGRRLIISSKFNKLQIGESLAVDGMCLTVVEVVDRGFAVDISPESLSVTVARHYAVGSRVNVERALRANDRLAGHWVTGHVDQVVHLADREARGDCQVLTFTGVLEAHRFYLIPKGSVAVNGVSLTVNRVDLDGSPGGFQVMVIPHTLEVTNLSHLELNDVVNVEFDLMAKLVARQLERQQSGGNDGLN